MRAIFSFFLIAIFALFLGNECVAFPKNTQQPAVERFKKMDTDNNGNVTREEFFQAQPNMKESAFSTIDTDSNGEITQAEWVVFMTGHNKDSEAAAEKPSQNADQPSPLLMPGKAK